MATKTEAEIKTNEQFRKQSEESYFNGLLSTLRYDCTLTFAQLEALRIGVEHNLHRYRDGNKQRAMKEGIEIWWDVKRPYYSP